MEISQAIKAVNRDAFVLQENGNLLPQTTATEAIANGLQLLDIQKGQRILEIGTGSGFSTALLATLVGRTGKVVSIDIDANLTKRAQKKISTFSQVILITGDGRDGYKDLALYDRMIAWTTPEKLPLAWKDQISDGGVIVAPFRVLPIAQSTVMVRLKKVNGTLQADLVGAEGYIMMTSEPVVDFFGPEIHADMKGLSENPYWASAEWMKHTPCEEWGEKFMQAKPQTSPFPEKGTAVRAYLLGLNPNGYTFAFHPDHGYWLGYSSSKGFALVSYHHPKQWIITDESHANILHNWWSDWQRIGKPSYEQLHPTIEDDQIKVTLKRR